MTQSVHDRDWCVYQLMVSYSFRLGFEGDPTGERLTNNSLASFSSNSGACDDDDRPQKSSQYVEVVQVSLILPSVGFRRRFCPTLLVAAIRHTRHVEHLQDSLLPIRLQQPVPTSLNVWKS